MGQTSLFYRLFDMLPLASYKWASAFLVFPSPAASYKLQSTREAVPRVVFSRIPTGWLPCFSLCGGRSHSVTKIQTGLSGLESTRWKRSSTIRQSSPRSFHRSPINSLTPVLSTLQRRVRFRNADKQLIELYGRYVGFGYSLPMRLGASCTPSIGFLTSS